MISLIAAVGENLELGKNGDLCWRIKEDLKRFKNLTTNHKVVMGYNTYKSLRFTPLPNRENIVVTKEPLSIEQSLGITQILEKDFEEQMEEWRNSPEEIFVIGGAKIYRKSLPYSYKIYLTKIHKKDPGADVFFPKESEWGSLYSYKVELETPDFSYITYTRL